MPLHRGQLRQGILRIDGVRELTRDDLLCLRDKRSVPAVQRLRDPHHALARAIASGLRPKEAAEQCGFSVARVYVLHSDPSFQDLVASYRKDVHDAFVTSEEERFRMANEVNRKALRTIAEHFDKAEAEGELIPLRSALSVFADTSDRVGLIKKSAQVNINIDYAAKLEAARARSEKVRVIEHSPQREPKLVRRI